MPLMASTQASKLFPHSSAVGSPGVLEFFAQIKAAQVRLLHLVQLENEHDVSGEIEFVFDVARLQAGIENSDSEVFQALRGVAQVADDGGEEADIRGVNVGGGESLLNCGLDDTEAAGAGVDEWPAKAHDLTGDVAAGAARNDTEK